MKTIVSTDHAPKAVGPYSQAVRAGDLLFCSGQIAIDPVTQGIISGGIQEQTHRVMDNLKAILEVSGASFSNVVKTSVFLANMNDFSDMNEVYGSYFDDEPPARECVEVSRLPKDVIVEISIIAQV